MNHFRNPKSGSIDQPVGITTVFITQSHTFNGDLYTGKSSVCEHHKLASRKSIQIVFEVSLVITMHDCLPENDTSLMPFIRIRQGWRQLLLHVVYPIGPD